MLKAHECSYLWFRDAKHSNFLFRLLLFLFLNILPSSFLSLLLSLILLSSSSSFLWRCFRPSGFCLFPLILLAIQILRLYIRIALRLHIWMLVCFIGPLFSILQYFLFLLFQRWNYYILWFNRLFLRLFGFPNLYVLILSTLFIRLLSLISLIVWIRSTI